MHLGTGTGYSCNSSGYVGVVDAASSVGKNIEDRRVDVVTCNFAGCSVGRD